MRARAQEAGLAYELIAARADLTPIVVAARRGDPEPDVRTLKGWRRELVGAELLELLRGRRRLDVGEGGRVEILALYRSRLRYRMKRGQLLLAVVAALAVGAVAWFAGRAGRQRTRPSSEAGGRRAGAGRTRSASPSPTRPRRRSCCCR